MPEAITPAQEQGLRRRMCWFKARYPTIGEARSASRRAKARTGECIGPYTCPWCPLDGERGYHIGHPPAMDSIRLYARWIRFGTTLSGDPTDPQKCARETA